MSTPSVNINLRPCDCVKDYQTGAHDPLCNGKPIPVPLSLQPFRSVTFKVVLGECSDRCKIVGIHAVESVQHVSDCPARPVRISCSISGSTWPDTKVSTVERHDGQELTDALVNACGERWALMKALVLGEHPLGFASKAEAERVDALTSQRDAVYAALAKVATMERSIFDAQGEYTSAMDEHHHPDWHRDPESYEMPSQKMMALYVERLVEQVGVLP